MEPLMYSAIILLTFIASVLITLLFFTRKSDASNPNLPPGKLGLPIIGESFEFMSTIKKGYPYSFISNRIARYSSQVFKTNIFGQPTVVVGGAAGNKFLFSNESKLVNFWLPESMNKIFYPTGKIPSGEKAKELRSLLPDALRPETLHQYIKVMDIVAQRHFETDWKNKQVVKVFPLVKKYALLVASKVFLGIDDEKYFSRLVKQYDRLVNGIISIPINFPGTSFNRGVTAANTIRKELMAIVKQRKIDLAENKASATPELLSRMLVTTDDDGKHFSDIDIVEKLLALLIAGSDTTTSAITFVVKNLSEFPLVYNRVLKEQLEIASSKKEGELLNWNDIQKMKYSWNAVCESMRTTPSLGNFREAIKDFTLGEYAIPKDWKLYWSPDTTHKNSTYFPEPEKFDPTRFEGNGPAPYTFVPFGGGPRICPGKDYARLLILVFVHNVVKRYKWEKFLPNEKITVDLAPMPVNGFPVHLYRHDV